MTLGDKLMDDLESELYTYMEAAVDGMMVKARAKLKLIEQEAEEYNAKELAELAKSRGALDREIAAMQRHEEQHKGRVELDVGGVRYVTSVETLRRVPWTFFDAYFSGRYQLDRSEDGSVFIDRDGSLFGHVLEYLRDGVVSVAEDAGRLGPDDVGLLMRLRREFSFYCMELLADGTADGGVEAAYVMGGVGARGKQLSSVERYNAAAGTWSEVAPMGTARSDFGACELSREVYVTGGFDAKRQRLATVEKYSPSTDTWSEVAAMPTPRSCHCCVAVGRFIYVISGVEGFSSRTSSVLMFDTTTDIWSAVAPLPVALANTVACVLGTHIYVFGGCDSDLEDRAETYRYDTETNEWSTCTPMPEGRHNHSVSVDTSGTFDRIYVLGGCTGDACNYSVLRFQPKARLDSTFGSWHELGHMLTGRHCAASYELGGHLYAVGGSSDDGGSNTVELYNTETRRWSRVADMNGERRNFGGAVVGAADGMGGQADLFESLITRARTN